MQTSSERPGPSLVDLCAVSAGTITMSPAAIARALLAALEGEMSLLYDPGLVVGVAMQPGAGSGSLSSRISEMDAP